MKIDFNRNYTMIALYALVVILCGILFIFAFSNFGVVWTYLVNFLSIFMPIFYGMFIAYLIYPIVKFFERRVFQGLLRKKKFGLARVLSVVSGFCIVIAGIGMNSGYLLIHAVFQLCSLYLFGKYLFSLFHSVKSLFFSQKLL